MNNVNREIIEISLEEIIPNRFQPRLTFDVEALNDLANSIKEHGIIQPLVVRKIQDKYEIIAGERRYKAASLVGLSKVPCIIMNLNDNESAEVAVIENIQRKEMTPLEEAKSFKKLLDKGYLTQEELAKRMGKSQSSIANKLRLLNLDELVQEAILNNKISERHARSLLKIADKNEQRQILSEILEKRLTVKQTDDLINSKTNVLNNETQNLLNPNIELNNKEVVNSLTEILTNEEPLSTPNVTIPYTNVGEEINPQMNLIRGLGSIEPNLPAQNENQNNDNMFNFNINDQKPISNIDIPKNVSEINKNDLNSNLNQQPLNIDNILNPSVFSNTNNNINKPPQIEENVQKETVLVDINQIKSDAMDIKEEEKPPIDVNLLLKTESPKPENKFFMDLNYQDEILDIAPEKNNNLKPSSSILEKINKNINELQLEGNKIHKEEVDLGNAYKITIIIDK